MTRDQIKARAREIYTLADDCNVPMRGACRRINMATSTPHRWRKEGSEPGAGNMESLRAAILRMANAQGSLAAKHVAEFKALPKERPRGAPLRPALEIARDIAKNVAELELSLSTEE